MPLLQCYTCYNVTSRVSEGEGRVTRDNIRYARGDGAVFYRLVGMGPCFEGSSYKYKLSSRPYLFLKNKKRVSMSEAN